MPATALVFSWFLGSLACTEPEATRRSTLAYVSIVEFLDILGVEEVIKSGLGDAGEGFVGGGEHSEGTGTGEGVGELAGLEGGGEGGEIGVATARSTIGINAWQMQMQPQQQ